MIGVNPALPPHRHSERGEESPQPTSLTVKEILRFTQDDGVGEVLGSTQRQAFTLIELLIVAALFSLTALLATTIFSNVQSTQRATSGQQRVTADGRYIMEKIAQSIRTETINYAWESNRINPGDPISYELTSPGLDDTLSTIDSMGKVTCYRLVGTNVEVVTDAPINCNASGTVFTPDDLDVEILKFYITPVSDPNRPVPRVEADCAAARVPVSPATPVTDGFDSTKGACVCSAANSCFTGQTCVSTATATFGAVCNFAISEQNCICQNPNVQPQVTIFLKTKSTSAGPGEQAEVSLQTTVVSRVYQR